MHIKIKKQNTKAAKDVQKCCINYLLCNIKKQNTCTPSNCITFYWVFYWVDICFFTAFDKQQQVGFSSVITKVPENFVF